MAIDFFNNQCQQVSSEKIFGLCDEEGTQKPAYIDVSNQDNWIAEIENEEQKEVYFIAIDNCIEIWRDDGNNLIFVELKDRKLRNASDFLKEAALQLIATINHFKKICDIADYNIKAAYIANKKKIHRSYVARMEEFQQETGYTLRIENRIKIPYMTP